MLMAAPAVDLPATTPAGAPPPGAYDLCHVEGESRLLPSENWNLTIHEVPNYTLMGMFPGAYEVRDGKILWTSGFLKEVPQAEYITDYSVFPHRQSIRFTFKVGGTKPSVIICGRRDL